ncbi:MAG: glycosyltransferase [Actinomycetia bacterium]|nr:glycosyltransferase [Actinomycetes bacterium]
MRESVKDGFTGLLVDRDEELFAKSISILLANRPLMEKLGKQGVKYVNSEWSWEVSTRKLIELLSEELTKCKEASNGHC